ncbi:unnamed protein product [Mesocestoides corti]|uniref:ATP-dependent DNA helicase n=1 Tax=Mesocestoides corti TaxID=53468 RepID=A0A0R3UPE3_MESCO|nr:unnamed protein product [Mesocestoides corti]
MGLHLKCSVSVEELSSKYGPIKRTIKLIKARIALVKSDNGCLIIRITPIGPHSYSKSLGYIVSEPTLHKKFLRQGKATIVLVENAWKRFSNVTRRRSLLPVDVPNTSLSLLDELSPLRILPSSNCNSVPVSGSLTALDLSPIGKPVKSNSTGSTSRNLMSTPIRKPKNREGMQVKRPSLPIKLGTEESFSHVLEDMSNKTTLTASGTTEQARVISLVKRGVNVFCTGGAGTGKSHLLRKIVGILPPAETAVVASTGVAASLIGGTTVHAFSGIGQMLDSTTEPEDLSDSWITSVRQRFLSDHHLVARWKRIRRIIIDEVSMISSRVFTRLEALARIARDNYDSGMTFGGVQVIAFGDFFQLPPVVLPSVGTKVEGKFAFDSPAWKACRFQNIELQTAWRQAGDSEYYRLLNEVREGRCPFWVRKALESRTCTETNKKQTFHEATIRLCTHRRDAEIRNREKLESLSGENKVFLAKDTGPPSFRPPSSTFVAPTRLELKVGSQVMLIRNLDITRGLVNGTRGVVESFTPPSEGSFPEVRFFTSARGSIREVNLVVRPERWTATLSAGGNGGEVQFTRCQLPLCLAWAISIHKSQGITLDDVEVELSKVFEHGQAYVALSRCRSLSGLRLLDWRPECIRVDPAVIRFYREIRGSRTDP